MDLALNKRQKFISNKTHQPTNEKNQFGSIWLIDKALSGAPTLGQSGPGSDGNEEVLCIP